MVTLNSVQWYKSAPKRNTNNTNNYTNKKNI